MSAQRYWIVVIDKSLPLKVKGDFPNWTSFLEWVISETKSDKCEVSYRLGAEDDAYAVICDKTFVVMCEELACHPNSKILGLCLLLNKPCTTLT
jgi:hypothetical protein